jgi:hypothetical protein
MINPTPPYPIHDCPKHRTTTLVVSSFNLEPPKLSPMEVDLICKNLTHIEIIPYPKPPTTTKHFPNHPNLPSYAPIL